jgi:hypothetical protein
MADSPCCPIGSHPEASAIDAALRRVGEEGAESLSAIARRTGLAKSSLSNHRRRCLEVGDGTPAEASPGSDAGASPGLSERPVPAPAERHGTAVNAHGTAAGTPSGPRSAAGSPFAVPNPGDDPLTAPRKVIQATLEHAAVDLRIRGKSYREIADQLEVSEEAALDAVERVLVRTRGKADERADLARAIEIARCEAIIAAFWERATDPGCAEVKVSADNEAGYRPYDGQDKAADRLLKAMERLAKLRGLDAATGPSTQINIVNNPVFVEMTTVILGALAAYPEALAAVKLAMRTNLQSRRLSAAKA